jgi:hypothetical protein
MPCYVFSCEGLDHKGERVFERFMHSYPDLVIDKTECECGAVAKRRFDKEIPTQAVIGLTSISHATTIKGSVADDLKFAFGDVKVNEDGSKDFNHRPFTNTGEMDKFLKGNNNLGKPKISQTTGKPLMKKDGTYIREGAEIVKLGPGAAPSKTDARRSKPKYKGVDWVSPREAKDFNTNSSSLKD